MGMDSIKSTCASLCGSVVVVTIIIAINCAIPISMIVMGALNIDECPAEDMIAIYLIVMGSFSLLRSIISIALQAKSDSGEETKVNPLTCIIDLFLFAWFIAGCVYIYRTKDSMQSHDTKADDYCDYTFYWYSFWITTASFIIWGAGLVIYYVVVCCSTICR